MISNRIDRRESLDIILFLNFMISLQTAKSLGKAEYFVKVLEILNFLTFLFQNRYPSLGLRIAGVTMKPKFYSVHPSVGYSYQLREMLWHQFAVSSCFSVLSI